MTHLTHGDADLHYEDGSHRTTPPTADGHQVELYERRIRRHLEAHAQETKTCTCPRIKVGHTVTEQRNLSPRCPVHGAEHDRRADQLFGLNHNPKESK